MRKMIDTTNIETAYREAEVKSAVCIGLDYGFETTVRRSYRGTLVKLQHVHVDVVKGWDIQEVVIQFLNENNMNDNTKNKIRVFKENIDVKGEHPEREKEGEDIFDTWFDALDHIMKLVWSIDNN